MDQTAATTHHEDQTVGSAQGRRDLQLVESALLSDPGAQRDLADRMRCIWRILMRLNQQNGITFSRDEMEDLAQDVSYLVLNKLPEYTGAGSLSTWAYPFCVHSFANLVRRKRRTEARMSGAELQPQDQTENPPDLILFDCDVVHGALNRILAAERQVIELRIFESRSFPEIGEWLHIPINTAKARYHRGVRKLRDLLAPAFGVDRP